MSWLPDWLTGYDEENAKRAAAADAELRRLNELSIASGKYTPAQVAAIRKDYEAQESFGIAEQRGSIDQAFQEGLDEGAGNVTGFIKGAFNFVGKALSSVLLGIPFWVWLIAAAALFVWLGGGRWLERKARGAFA